MAARDYKAEAKKLMDDNKEACIKWLGEKSYKKYYDGILDFPDDTFAKHFVEDCDESCETSLDIAKNLREPGQGATIDD